MTTYEALLKDRAIIAAEVLHEYDVKVRYISYSHERHSKSPISMFPHGSIQ
jgi:hypothetical protein